MSLLPCALWHGLDSRGGLRWAPVPVSPCPLAPTALSHPTGSDPPPGPALLAQTLQWLLPNSGACCTAVVQPATRTHPCGQQHSVRAWAVGGGAGLATWAASPVLGLTVLWPHRCTARNRSVALDEAEAAGSGLGCHAGWPGPPLPGSLSPQLSSLSSSVSSTGMGVPLWLLSWAGQVRQDPTLGFLSSRTDCLRAWPRAWG